MHESTHNTCEIDDSFGIELNQQRRGFTWVSILLVWIFHPSSGLVNEQSVQCPKIRLTSSTSGRFLSFKPCLSSPVYRVRCAQFCTTSNGRPNLSRAKRATLTNLSIGYPDMPTYRICPVATNSHRTPIAVTAPSSATYSISWRKNNIKVRRLESLQWSPY